MLITCKWFRTLSDSRLVASSLFLAEHILTCHHELRKSENYSTILRDGKTRKAKFNYVVRFRLYNDNRNPTSEMKRIYWNGCDDIFVSVANFFLFFFQVSNFPSTRLTISVCWKWGLFSSEIIFVGNYNINKIMVRFSGRCSKRSGNKVNLG